MADEHTVSGVAHTGPEPSEPTLAKTAGAPVPTGPPGSADLVRGAAPAPRVQKPDVKNSVVLALAVVILFFTGISGVAIWAAASFDGGRPGITGPADGHREPPVIEPADRTRPPQTLEPDEAATAPAAAETGTERPGTEPAPLAPATEPAAGEPRAGQPQTGRDAARGAAVDWNTVAYPQDCPGAPYDVRDARPLTEDARTYIVQVRCAAGSGTAPDGLYTYALAPDGGPPALLGTLLAAGEDRVVKEFAIRDGKIHATLQGWSTEEVPRCCPDTEETRVLTP
ncbi:hypothetical protein [Streptodolium elevatio]|uniref:Serine/threonine protein kinase n=1 Tax=Streptodolium elevatio TaxID=3157996 RepID=A0ABV3DIW7_9ACTN